MSLHGMKCITDVWGGIRCCADVSGGMRYNEGLYNAYFIIQFIVQI